MRLRLEPFDYASVEILDGALRSPLAVARDYDFAIPDDDALRASAFAPASARGDRSSAAGGDPARRTWWSNGDTFNTFGQWLST